MVVSAVLIASCAGQPVSPFPSDGNRSALPEGLLAGEVLRVEDGDTFVLETVGGEITVRLLGVNAPERDECLHDEAGARLALYLQTGDVGVEDHGTDQFGRTLGYVWAGETLVNLGLVEDGLTIATTPSDFETWGASLLAAEESAYQARLGLWAEAVCDGGAGTDFELVIDTSGHNPPGADDDSLGLEHITIINNGDAVTDISGWVLRDESSAHRLRFPNGSVIGPGAELQVNSDDPSWEPGGTPVWNNEGDMALLLTPTGEVAARQRYRP